MTGDCNDQFKGNAHAVGADFCDRIHRRGNHFEECLKSIQKKVKTIRLKRSYSEQMITTYFVF
jgi:hypothetical protein